MLSNVVPDGQVHFTVIVEHLTVTRVAGYQPILRVVAREAFGDALDRFGQTLLTSYASLFRPPKQRDVVYPANPLPTGEADMTTLIGNLDVRDQ